MEGTQSSHPPPNQSHYDHRPLVDPLTQIRLCRLLPHRESPIGTIDLNLEIEHVSLPHHPSVDTPYGSAVDDANDRQETDCPAVGFPGFHIEDYVALSYMWGPSTSCHHIRIKEHRLPISDNLWTFLTTLRSKADFATWYFIDQICIDQTNISERNDQVKIMGSIYAQAARVCVWLGEASNTSADAMQMLREFDLGSRLYRPYAWRHKSHFVRDRSAIEITRFRELMQRPYWSRLWIIQELFHARKMVFMCGMEVYEPAMSGSGLFQDAARARQLFRRAFPSETSLHLRRMPQANHPLLWRILRGEKKTLLPLDELIANFCTQGCANPRDRVYGLLGCARPDHRVEVHYEAPVETVFWGAVKLLCGYWRAGNYVDGIEKSLLLLRDSMGLDGQHGHIAEEQITESFHEWMGWS